MPSGVKAMRLAFLVAGLLAFLGLYVYFFIKIWDASGKKPPALDKQLLYVASLLTGVLGTYFAVALGIQRKDPKVDQSKLKLGETLVGAEGPGAALGTAALWL